MALTASASHNPVRLNAHIHLPPNFSAFETVAQAVRLAADEGLCLLGASNYYDYSVYAEFADRCRAAGILPLFGLETIALLEDLRDAGIKINDPGNPGKLYLCGKGAGKIQAPDSATRVLLDTVRRNDSARMSAMIFRLSEVCAAAGIELGLSESIIVERIVARHGCAPEWVYLQERHLAQAFQEAIFEALSGAERAAALERLFGSPAKRPDDAVAVQNDLRSHLMKAGKPAFVTETFVGFEHAYRLILGLGAIPCYPTLADGANPICSFEASVDDLIRSIRARGIHCAELIPIRNRPDVLTEYVCALRRAGLVVTGGTEHNTLDLIPLEPRCLGGEAVPDEVQAIFLEGACVVAAHQQRVAEGRPGFVATDGALNPDYPTDEARIAAFAAEGAAQLRL